MLKRVSVVIALLLAVLFIGWLSLFYGYEDLMYSNKFYQNYLGYVSSLGLKEEFDFYTKSVDSTDGSLLAMASCLGYEIALMQEDISLQERIDRRELKEEEYMVANTTGDGGTEKISKVVLSCKNRQDFYYSNEYGRGMVGAMVNSVFYCTEMFAIHCTSENKGDVATRMVADAISGCIDNLVIRMNEIRNVRQGMRVTTYICIGLLVLWYVIVKVKKIKLRRVK